MGLQDTSLQSKVNDPKDNANNDNTSLTSLTSLTRMTNLSLTGGKYRQQRPSIAPVPSSLEQVQLSYICKYQHILLLYFL